MDRANTPFEPLGKELQSLREKHKESLAEVSGAIEIDVDTLKKYESGTERPSEDILMLIISHFGLRDDKAVELWQLAQYDPNRKTGLLDNILADADPQNRSVVVMMTLDTRVLYCDNVHITADKNGVVMNFLQNTPSAKNTDTPVARIGMSYEHAHDVLRVLNNTLTQAEALRKPKSLPSPKHPKNQNPDNK